MARAVSAALDRLDEDPGLAVGVLTGAGGHFCAGMDLKAFLKEGFPFIGHRGLAGVTRAEIGKPMIAAVEGAAVAGGCEIALACDLIVAGESAKFGLSEVARGLVASEGGVIRLPQRVPYHIAMQMLLTGDPLDAPSAARFGLVNHVVADGMALPAALALAERVSRNAPLAIAAVRRIVREARGATDRDAFVIQDAIVAPVAESQDAREGARAFAEKRPPSWKGR
ncbi:crotonase/enoyl-CoA hydratase family protein [Pendulispora rubella]|uniref:Crotonase/enoyl-CoA hydratase family protein n=1 Tax=Pendulispora rubella TaxID=2741070 RepID=A0ABZ2L946_9BACT